MINCEQEYGYGVMTIEQVLIKSMKTSRGLHRGRGMTDSALIRLITFNDIILHLFYKTF